MKYFGMLLALYSSSCLADLNQDTPVPDLYLKSDHVFAGRVTAAHRTAQAAGSVGAVWLIDFEPLRLYKETFAPGIITVGVVEFNESWGSPGNPGESQLIFAKKSTGESSAPLVLTEPLSIRALDLASGAKPSVPGLDMLGLDQLEADALAVAFQGGPQSSQAFDILISFPEFEQDHYRRSDPAPALYRFESRGYPHRPPCASRSASLS